MTMVCGMAFVIGGTIYPKIQAAGPARWPLVGLVEPWQQMFNWVGLPGILTLDLVGFFVGPTAVALVTDFCFLDEAQLRHSLATVAGIVAIIGMALLLYNMPHFRRSAEEAKSWAP